MSCGDEERLVNHLTVFQEHWTRYRAVTLQILQLTPEDRLAWAPAADQRTLAETFAHIAAGEAFYMHGLVQADWDRRRLQLDAVPTTRAALDGLLRRGRAEAELLLDRLAPDTLDEVVTVPGVPVAWTRYSWLWFVLEHEIHHKAQLAHFLRVLGVEPPFFALALPPGSRPDRGAHLEQRAPAARRA